jgi:hypothetical protein
MTQTGKKSYGLKTVTPRVAVLILLGCAVLILVIKGCLYIWAGNYRRGILFPMAATALFIVFFRKRKIALTIIGLTFVAVNVGLTSIFHPTILGILLSSGAVGCLYLLCRWSAKKFPHLAANDWQTIFDHDPKV